MREIKENLILIAKLLTCLLVLSPGILYILSNENNIWFNLGNTFALIGFTGLSITNVLGCRSFWLERIFGSLSASFFLHHFFGIATIIAIIFHILLSSLPSFLLDFRQAFHFFTDLQDPIIVSGWVSFLILVLGSSSVCIKGLARESWRWLHRFMALAPIVILIHVWFSLVRVDLPEILALAIVLFSGFVLCLHFFFPQFLRKTISYIVSDTKTLSGSLIEISLAPVRQSIRYSCGQYVYISVNCEKGCGVSHEFHPFTIDSAPQEKTLRLMIRALGDDSRRLQHICVGNRVEVEGPYGNLLKDVRREDPQLWIAGGIGITPFLSCARQWRLDSSSPPDIVLILLLKTEQDNVYSEDLYDIKTILHIDDRDGRPNLNMLLPKDWQSRRIVISGPLNMVKKFRTELKRKGAKGIATEEFDF